MGFKVYYMDGNDATEERKWLIGTDGKLYYTADNDNGQLMEAEIVYGYSMN